MTGIDYSKVSAFNIYYLQRKDNKGKRNWQRLANWVKTQDAAGELTGKAGSSSIRFITTSIRKNLIEDQLKRFGFSLNKNYFKLPGFGVPKHKLDEHIRNTVKAFGKKYITPVWKQIG